MMSLPFWEYTHSYLALLSEWILVPNLSCISQTEQSVSELCEVSSDRLNQCRGGEKLQWWSKIHKLIKQGFAFKPATCISFTHLKMVRWCCSHSGLEGEWSRKEAYQSKAEKPNGYSMAAPDHLVWMLAPMPIYINLDKLLNLASCVKWKCTNIYSTRSFWGLNIIGKVQRIVPGIL